MSNYNFNKFMKQSDFLKLTVSLLISSQIVIFVNEFVSSIISPIIIRIFEKRQDSLENIKFTRFGINFKIAKLINALIRALVTILVVYFLVRILNDSGLNIQVYKEEK